MNGWPFDWSPPAPASALGSSARHERYTPPGRDEAEWGPSSPMLHRGLTDALAAVLERHPLGTYQWTAVGAGVRTGGTVTTLAHSTRLLPEARLGEDGVWSVFSVREWLIRVYPRISATDMAEALDRVREAFKQAGVVISATASRLAEDLAGIGVAGHERPPP